MLHCVGNGINPAISPRIAVWVDKSYNEASKASDGNCARMVVMEKAGNILPFMTKKSYDIMNN